jgi:transaldolase
MTSSSLKSAILIAIAFLLELPHSSSFTPPHRGDCRFFLDTADTFEWDDLLPTGMFHGVTTNPTILARANQPCTVSNLHSLAEKALSLTDEFMCQTWGSTAEQMYNNGMEISKMDRERIVIKVPVTAEGTKAATMLAEEGVRICLTACYNSKQALIAASMGVEYIAPYLGRYVEKFLSIHLLLQSFMCSLL